jgi:hypothetical protein
MATVLVVLYINNKPDSTADLVESSLQPVWEGAYSTLVVPPSEWNPLVWIRHASAAFVAAGASLFR